MLFNLSPRRILFPLFRCLFTIGKALSKTIWFTSKDPVTTYTKWHLRVKRVFSRHTRRTGVGRTATTCRSHWNARGIPPPCAGERSTLFPYSRRDPSCQPGRHVTLGRTYESQVRRYPEFDCRSCSVNNRHYPCIHVIRWRVDIKATKWNILAWGQSKWCEGLLWYDAREPRNSIYRNNIIYLHLTIL